MTEPTNKVQHYPRSRYRTMVLWLVLALGTVTAIIGLDFVFGYVHTISMLRVSAQQFRSEVARLPIRTLNLVPNTNHAYYSLFQGSTGANSPPEAPRSFRTDMNGNIKSGRNSKGEALKKILFLGGSTTESNEIDEPFRFPAVVETLLNDEYSIQVEVWNGGVRSHTTVDSINLLLNNAEYSKATHVVLMHNINDRLLLAFQDRYQSKLGTSGDTSWDKLKDASYALGNALKDFASYHSNLLFAARMHFARFHPFSGEEISQEVSEDSLDLDDPKLEEHAIMYRTYLEAFIGLSKALSKVPIVMTQPLGRPSKGQARFNDELRAVALAHQVKIIDLDRLLPANREWLFLSDSIHMNNEGGKLVGHIIAGVLSEVLGGQMPKVHYQPVIAH